MVHKNPWKTLKSKTHYDNPWIKVEEHRVLNPAGNPGIYGTVHFKNLAIGVIPVDQKKYTWLVGQYRYPLKDYSWEIPEGGGRIGVSPLVTAKRELSEETGLKAKRYRLLLTMHLSNSVSDELAYIYLASEITQGNAHPEEDEVLKIWYLPLEKAYRMVLQGKITDSMSVAGLLRTRELYR